MSDNGGVDTDMAPYDNLGADSEYDVQKYLVVYEDERPAKDQVYNTFGHAFSRKKGEAVSRARAKSGHKLRRVWIIEWRDMAAVPEQVSGIVQGKHAPAVVTSIITQTREVLKTQVVSTLITATEKPRVAKAPAPSSPPSAPAPTKKKSTFHPPYEVEQAPILDK